MPSGEFQKQYELYTELRKTISESEYFAVTGSGCAVPVFVFDIDFVNEYGDRFHLFCEPMEEEIDIDLIYNDN